jgi:excisionase family DNA binding protein
MMQETTLLNVKDVAGMLNLGVSTVWRHVKNGEMPKPIKIGRAVRWRTIDIQKWLDDRAAV